MVDWKWEYMEEAFARLTVIIDVFLISFNAESLRTPVGQLGGQSEGIDPKCIATIQKAVVDRKGFSALIEAFHVFARACGREAGWFTGCRCHDYIWRQRISDAAKLAQFREAAGYNAEECMWRGRRASELARGYWKMMIERVGSASSGELHARLSAFGASEEGGDLAELSCNENFVARRDRIQVCILG